MFICEVVETLPCGAWLTPETVMDTSGAFLPFSCSIAFVGVFPHYLVCPLPCAQLRRSAGLPNTVDGWSNYRYFLTLVTYASEIVFRWKEPSINRVGIAMTVDNNIWHKKQVIVDQVTLSNYVREFVLVSTSAGDRYP